MKISIHILSQGNSELLEKTKASIRLDEEFEFVEDASLAQGEWLHTLAEGSLWTEGYFEKIKASLENKHIDVISGPELPHRDLSYVSACYRIALGSPLSIGTLFPRFLSVGRKLSFCGKEKLNPRHLWERRNGEKTGFFYHPKLIVRSLDPHMIRMPHLYAFIFIILLGFFAIDLGRIYLMMLIGVGGGLALRSYHFLGLPLIVMFQFLIPVMNGILYAKDKLTKTVFR